MKKHLLFLGAVLLSGCWMDTSVLKAEVIGDPVIARPNFDGGTGQLFVYAGLFSNPGDRVSTWSFWSDTSASNNCSTGAASYVCYPGASITPVLLDRTGSGSFTVRGIGTTRPNAITGLQTFTFGLVAGSDIVGSQTTFGFRSGGPNDTGDFDFGVVDFDSSPGLGFYSFGERATVAVGSSYATGGTPSRAYSIQFATSPVPEPANLTAAGLAALLVIQATRRRLRRPRS